MGWTTGLLGGIAEWLAAGDVGVWRPSGPPYIAGETGIVIGAMPPQPDRIVALAHYPVEDHIAHALVVAGIQVRTRAGPDPTAVQDLDDQVYEILHGLTQTTFGEAHVIQCWRRSSAALGQARDERDLWERTSNYYCDAVHATAARPI